jgi:Protein of unknown function (DUF4038)/Domain of unknown function (DUF5060)
VNGHPFDTGISGEFTGPHGARLRVPGFYDGDGVWKIRFAPPSPGTWSLRTVSASPELNGKEAVVEAIANRNPRIHGILRVDPEHPFHFRFEDGTRYFLMGYEADWLWGADMLDPSRKLMHRLIDQIAARGFNYVLVNVYAYDTRWCPGKSNPWDFGPAPLYPWAGTNSQPDHSRLNPAFFKIYDGMMQALLEKGVIAQVMFKVYNKGVNWPTRDGPDEARYFRYVTARYEAYPNVVWDYSKEGWREPDNALKKRLIDLVRAGDAYGHLMTLHDDDRYAFDPQYSRDLDFLTEQKHAAYAGWIAFGRNLRAWPVLNAEFGYELGVEPLPTQTQPDQVDWKTLLDHAYRIYFAGGYAAYYYNNTAWDVVKPDPEPGGMRRWEVLKQVFSGLPYWRMQPHDELVAGGACLAETGGMYAFYVPRGAITINLRGRRVSSPAEWIDTWTALREPAGRLAAAVITVKKPKAFGEAPAVLVLR